MRPLTDEQRTQIMHYFPPRLGKFVVPGAGVFDAPFYCLIINVEWIGHLIGVLDALDQLDAWIGTSEEIEFARQEVRRLITGINPCEESNLVLRQNPDVPCLLEQSIDGGLNWTLAFDYSLCLEKESIQQTINNYQTAIDYGNTYNTLYDGTPESISDFDGDSNRDNLMCYATSVFINAALDDAVDAKERERTITGAFTFISALVASALFVPTGGASWIFLSAVLAATGGTVAIALTSLEIETLNNQDARNAVICCMNDAIVGSVPTETLFSEALDGCSFTAGSDAEEIRAIMQQYLQETDMYIAWLRLADESKGIAGIGQLPCPCEDEWCYGWFDGNGYSPTWNIVSSGGGFATYDAVNDRIEGYKHNVANTGAFIDMNIAVNEYVSSLEVEIPYNATRATASDFVRVYVNGSLVYNSGISGSGTVIETFTIDNNVTSIRIHASAGKVTQGDAGYIRVTKVIVNGNGDNPFGTDNC